VCVAALCCGNSTVEWAVLASPSGVQEGLVALAHSDSGGLGLRLGISFFFVFELFNVDDHPSVTVTRWGVMALAVFYGGGLGFKKN